MQKTRKSRSPEDRDRSEVNSDLEMWNTFMSITKTGKSSAPETGTFTKFEPIRSPISRSISCSTLSRCRAGEI